MYESKRYLRRKIVGLEQELNNIKYVNSLVEDSGFEQCKSTLCQACAHAVWMKNLYQRSVIIGCDKSKSCADFERLPGTSGNDHGQSGADKACNCY